MISAITLTASIWVQHFRPIQAMQLIILLVTYLQIHRVLYARNTPLKITTMAAVMDTPVPVQAGPAYLTRFARDFHRTATAGVYVSGEQYAGQPVELSVHQVHAARELCIHTAQKHGSKF